MKRIRSEKKLICCIHEAGHAVVHHYLGHQVDRVFIAKRGTPNGGTVVITSGHRVDGVFFPFDLERYGPGLIAGSVAEFKCQGSEWTGHDMLYGLNGNYMNSLADGNIKVLRAFAKYARLNDSDTADTWNRYAERATPILEEHWDEVTAVAVALYEQSELTRGDFLQFVGPLQAAAFVMSELQERINRLWSAA